MTAISVDDGINATLYIDKNKSTFSANGKTVRCEVMKTIKTDSYLATPLNCDENVQLVLKEFLDTKNSYLAVMTDSFSKVVLKFPVLITVSD